MCSGRSSFPAIVPNRAVPPLQDERVAALRHHLDRRASCRCQHDDEPWRQFPEHEEDEAREREAEVGFAPYSIRSHWPLRSTFRIDLVTARRPELTQFTELCAGPSGT